MIPSELNLWVVFYRSGFPFSLSQKKWLAAVFCGYYTHTNYLSSYRMWKMLFRVINRMIWWQGTGVFTWEKVASCARISLSSIKISKVSWNCGFCNVIKRNLNKLHSVWRVCGKHLDKKTYAHVFCTDSIKNTPVNNYFTIILFYLSKDKV